MTLRSSADRYGSVAVTMHWVTAAALLLMLGSGLTVERMGDAPARIDLLRLHVVLGVLVGLLTLMRIAWWLAFDRGRATAELSRLQALAARAVHLMLYGVILVMVSSGVATVLASGASLQLLAGVPGPLPDFDRLVPFSIHALLYKVLLVLAAGHIGAALWHQFVRRDRVLARMGLGR